MNSPNLRLGEGEGDNAPVSRQRPLPHDLPRSLNDRHPVPEYGAETEMYDAWQGMQ